MLSKCTPPFFLVPSNSCLLYLQRPSEDICMKGVCLGIGENVVPPLLHAPWCCSDGCSSRQCGDMTDWDCGNIKKWSKIFN
jgi:hypothetical protein